MSGTKTGNERTLRHVRVVRHHAGQVKMSDLVAHLVGDERQTLQIFDEVSQRDLRSNSPNPEAVKWSVWHAERLRRSLNHAPPFASSRLA
jgi:hypothetical protein